MPHAFRLDAAWHPDAGQNGCFAFTLVNLGTEAVTDIRVAYTALTRVVDDADVRNARLIAKDGNFHQFAAPDGLTLAPGGRWLFEVGGLHRPARHRSDGPKSAYVTLANGRHIDAAVSDLMLEGRPSEPERALLPDGRVEQPFAIQPWPRHLDRLAAGDTPVTLYPEEAADLDALRAIDAVTALHARLFPADHAPFSLAASAQGRPLRIDEQPDLGADAYDLAFTAEGVTIAYGDPAGRFYGLVTLAQLLRGARKAPDMFRFPQSGRIADAPRHGWRGCHLDVSRQFYPVGDVTRLLDILAWFKLNVFHWHLTDDEAWRLEIKGFPELTTTGVLRGPDAPLKPQLGNGAEPVGGFYSQDDVRHVVRHASALHIDVVPEIDIPGHNAATLAALPDLRDGQEAPDSYRSVQGFANNALNPALPLTYRFVEAVLDEVVALFPSRFVHIGGDEVAADAWLASPRAKALMAQEGLSGTHDLQAHFMRRVKAMLTKRGKVLAGWNEVAHGDGIDPKDTVLMAWETPEVGIALAREGYDVVMTPGQAYYLDMVQDDAWQEPGASWAGTVPPAHTYAYEAAGDFSAELQERLKGVQACIWSENFLSRDYFNRLVFPRLPAVAEAAWTPQAAKDWQRFAAIVRLSPTL